jgi:ubiquinone/menaquinone biosynthesis C-methylase UbiE/GT2 family glycosyltransferase
MVGEVQRVRGVYAEYHRSGRSQRWTEDRAIHAERRRLTSEVLGSMGAGPGRRVLDLGCGRGDLIDELLDAGFALADLTGVDLLPDRLQLALERGMACGVASGEHLPFPDDTFDVVTAFTLLSSVGDETVLTAMSDEVRRVLRPGGALLVYDLRIPNPVNRSVRPLPLARLRTIFPGWTLESRTCTVLPPIARRLAPDPGSRYDLLARLRLLRSHRLTVLRPPALARPDLPTLPVDAKVTVILPVRNEGAFIERSLGAVLTQQGVEPAEVIVVDGDSDDGTPDRVRLVASSHGAAVTVLHNPQRIVPVSMNLGLARATGEVIVRVDGHCLIDPDYLRRCLDALGATGEACVGGPMETVGETGVAASIAAAQRSRFGVGGVAFRTSAEARFVDTLAFGAYRREVFEHIGTFDEELVRNQDDEFNLRLTRAGGRIWMDPSIRSTYFSRGTFGGLWRQYHGYGFYKVRVMRKHRTVPSPRHLVPAAFVGAVAGAAALSAARRSPLPLVAIAAPYAAAVGSSAAQATVPGTRTRDIAVATATMHAAYGLGWWAGAVRELRQSRRRTAGTR